MPRHITTQQGTVPSRYSTVRDPRLPQVQTRANPGISSTQFQYPNWPGRNGPVTGLDAFRFDFQINQPGPEFFDNGKRRREPTPDEKRERLGQNLFQNFGAIASGTEGTRPIVNPITGEPAKRFVPSGQRGVRGYFATTEKIPSFNISPNTINQQASAQRQQLVVGAGNRRDPRFGGAQTAAINQSFGASFAGQSVALNDLQRTNVQTKKFGVTGQKDLLGLFQREAGQRADIRLTEDSLRLGLEQLKVGKEGQDLQAALEKQRLGILAFSAREQAAMNAFNRWLDKARLQFDIDKENNKGGISFGGIAKILGRGIAAYITGGASEAVLAASDAIGQGNERDFIRNPDPR